MPTKDAQIEKSEVQLHENPQRFTSLHAMGRGIKHHAANLARVGAFIGGSIALGWADSMHPMSNPYVAYFCNATYSLLNKALPTGLLNQLALTSGNNVYQFDLMAPCFILPVVAFYHADWGKLRNSLNVAFGVTASFILDFFSAAFTKPAGQSPFVDDKGNIQWRIHAAEHSAILEPAAHIINQPSIIFPGGILGWDIGLAVGVAVGGIQLYLSYRPDIVQLLTKPVIWTKQSLVNTTYAILELMAKQ